MGCENAGQAPNSGLQSSDAIELLQTFSYNRSVTENKLKRDKNVLHLTKLNYITT